MRRVSVAALEESAKFSGLSVRHDQASKKLASKNVSVKEIYTQLQPAVIHLRRCFRNLESSYTQST